MAQGYFSRSAHGFFKRGAHGYRGGAEPGDWFLTNSSNALNYWTGTDGINFSNLTAAAGIYEASQLAFMTYAPLKRLIGATKYTDSPFGSIPEMKLDGSNFSSVGMSLGAIAYCVRTGNNLVAAHPTTGTMCYSTDGGANWTSVTLTAPTDNNPNTFRAFASRPIVTSTGRVLIIATWTGASAPTMRFFSHYSDDGGVTWTASASYAQNSANTTRSGILYQKAGGTILFIPSNGAGGTSDIFKKRSSTDDGQTWSLGGVVATGWTATDASADINGTRTTARRTTTSLGYSDNDFTTFTNVGSIGLITCHKNKDIYYVGSGPSLRKSTDGGQNFSTVVTSPTTFTNGFFLAKLGHLW